MNCATVDELAAAFGLGAVEPAEELELSEHLATCAEPHAEARDLIGAASMVAASAEPVSPGPRLRDRVLATAAATPQEHRLAGSPASITPIPVDVRRPSEPWWRRATVPLALAAVALAAAIGLGLWNVSLRQQVAERDEAIRAIAGADAVHQVSGTAGSGLLLESGGTAFFLAEGLADLADGQLYELWLIGADGVPVAVGSLDDPGEVALVTLEQEIGSATTFAVTVEAERVDAPTGEPVMVASLEG